MSAAGACQSSSAPYWQEGFEQVRARPVLLEFLAVAALMGLSSEGYDRLWTAHMLVSFHFPTLVRLSQAAWFGLLRWQYCARRDRH
jgi:hypothetical protein